mgnify:CR=1 FL=1
MTILRSLCCYGRRLLKLPFQMEMPGYLSDALTGQFDVVKCLSAIVYMLFANEILIGDPYGLRYLYVG